MVTLMLLGFSITNIDGYVLKVCHYRAPGFTRSFNLPQPKTEKCLRTIKLGK